MSEHKAGANSKIQSRIIAAAQHRHATDVLCRRNFTIRWHGNAFPFNRIRAIVSHAADGYPLGRMWLMDSFCVGAIRHSARLLGALGRDLGQMPTSLALQSAHSNFTRPFLFRSALIRGNRFWQPNTALQPTPLAGRSRSGRFHGKACAMYLVCPLQGRG